MKCKITNHKITSLADNEIFVFGSNLEGNHAGGAARVATQFGAIMGNPKGFQGQSYAIPTLNERYQQLDLNQIQEYVNELEQAIKQRPDLHFLITAIGTGIAGFSISEIAPLFTSFLEYENVSLPIEFINQLTQ